MTTVQTLNWVNPKQQVLPVKYSLKTDDPEIGVEKKNVEKAVKYASDVYGKDAVFPPKSELLVFRQPDKKMGGVLLVPNDKTGKSDALELNTTTKDEKSGLFKIANNTARYLSGKPMVIFAGKAPAKAPTQGLSLMA